MRKTKTVTKKKTSAKLQRARGGQIIPRTTLGDQYPFELSGIYRSGVRITDPDFALSQDPEVYEKAERDAKVKAVISDRKHSVAGRKWNLVAGDPDNEASKQKAKIVEHLLGRMKKFSELRFQLGKAIFRGSAHARIYGERRLLTINGITARWWYPTRAREIDKRRFQWISHQENGRSVIRRELWSVDRMRWEKIENPEFFIHHLYNDEEASLRHGHGLMQAIYFTFRAKMIVLEEGLAGLEKWARGMQILALDSTRIDAASGQTLAKIAKEYVDILEKLRGRHILVHDKADELKHEDAPGTGSQIVQDMLNYLDNAITILGLGSVMPTSATTGGSFALAEIQENSSERLIQFDRDILAETITESLVALILRLNRPQFLAEGLADAEDPYFQIIQEKIEDPQKNAGVIRTALESQVPLRKDEVYQKLGFTQPLDDDDVFSGIERSVPGLPPPFGVAM